jgi:hypothetical protein
MKASHTDNYERSQRELAAGVLKQAKQDLQRFHAAPSAIERELYLDAYRWLMSDDSTWPFSFLNVCQSLNLVPEDVRQDLIGNLSVSTFSRWLRHCVQAFERFQRLLPSASRIAGRAKTAVPTTLVHTLH